MHINEQEDPVDLPNMEIRGAGMFSKSCCQLTACQESSGTYTKKDSFLSGQIEASVQRNYFSPHWSMVAVEKAVEVRTVVSFVYGRY